MKNFFYGLLIKLGYKVENIKKAKSAIETGLQRFDVLQNKNLLFRAHRYIENINREFPDLSISDSGEGVLVSFSGLKIYVESAEEFFIINEVFIEKDYNFLTPADCILVDIGANIGISSLYFSRISSVRKIYAFEPVADTFSQAKENFARNGKNDTIAVENIGLGNSSRRETFIFNKMMKGNTGLRGKLSKSYAQAQEYDERPVQIEDADGVFRRIISENPREKIVVKMDCEGAEYEIIGRLSETNLLGNIHAFLIEWHDKGAASIEQPLRDAGFFVFSRQLTPESGMIYCVKNH